MLSNAHTVHDHATAPNMNDHPLPMNDIKEEENVFYHPEGISYEYEPHYYREAYY